MDLNGCVTMDEMLSEALLGGVPVFKQEILKHGSHYHTTELLPSGGHLSLAQGRHHVSSMPGQTCPTSVSPYLTPPTQRPLPHLQAINPASYRQDQHPSGGAISSDWVNFMTSVNFHHLDDAESRFQYILAAATSPAVKLDEEVVTYLNQGQSYELKLKRSSDHCGERLLKSRVRVVFHERRLQYMEREQMEHWRTVRPGERILDLDIPISYGLVDLKIDSHNLNCFEFTWDADLDTAIFIKINCISTEFTAKKHGGEKGVPFRIQVETYSPGGGGVGVGGGMNGRLEPHLVHCASCQVKVFKPKGADRKHKTDRDKIDKLSDVDRDKYQPSFEYTILTEIPLEQVVQYLEQIRKQQDSDRPGSFVKEERSLPSATVVHVSNSCLQYRTGADCGGQTIADSSSKSGENDCRSPLSNSHTSSVSRGKKFFDETPSDSSALEPASSFAAAADVLPVQATSSQVSQWLRCQRFPDYVQTFQNFSGADILRLSREDLIQLCGPADGIRLNNALHVRSVRPRLTLHVYLEPIRCYSTYDSNNNNNNIGESSNNAAGIRRISAPSPSGCWSPSSSNSPSSILSSFQSAGTTTADSDQTSSPRTPRSPPPLCTSSVSDTTRNFQRLLSSNKRSSSVEIEADHSSSSGLKKRCAELQSNTVFHAVHLEHLTTDDLLNKLAKLYNMPSKQMSEVYIQTSSGIIIYVNDSVVQNISDLSRFTAEVKEDDQQSGLYHALLKILDAF